MISKIALFIAQGFGVGRAPLAPGTFGTLLGFVWFSLLLAPGNVALFLTGILFGIVASVLFSEIGEEVLRQKDPGSVVIDEIIAIPICFLGWIYFNGIPTPRMMLHHWKLCAAIFVAFRIFDIWKPWPVRQSQSLPGGWGVTIDDVLAAIYVALISAFFLRY
jgi:phosphatidylglycerophosphatase A